MIAPVFNRRGECSDRRGFSLVETIVAIGIFAIAITIVLGLMPSLARTATESVDALVAQQLPSALEVELRRLCAGSDFNTVAASIPIMTAPLENGTALVAARTGDRVVLRSESASVLAAGSEYFLLELWRFPTAPLAYDASGAVLAMHVRVSWPYQLPGASAVTPFGERTQFSFNAAVNR